MSTPEEEKKKDVREQDRAGKSKRAPRKQARESPAPSLREGSSLCACCCQFRVGREFTSHALPARAQSTAGLQRCDSLWLSDPPFSVSINGPAQSEARGYVTSHSLNNNVFRSELQVPRNGGNDEITVATLCRSTGSTVSL
ncbi:hypothetical protein ABG768_009862 [Culter alburnus]|uniref:Uncharacterized protein n=1 Tax=Culter alburnus TaxID=194366 RepID=A0AAW1ZE69_CULAL